MEYSRNVSLHISSCESSEVEKKWATKRGKRVRWVIYEVFGNTQVLTVIDPECRLKSTLEAYVFDQ